MPARCASSGVANNTGRPSTRMLPASGEWTPETILMSVDLPAPFLPSSACRSPAAISKRTPLSAWTPGNDLLMSCSSRTGGMHLLYSPVGVASLAERAASCRGSNSVLEGRFWTTSDCDLDRRLDRDG